MEGEGDGVEVALGDDAGGVDELLEVGAALHRGLVEVRGGADGLEMDVDDGVGFGQKARGFGWCLGAQIEHAAECGEDDDDDQQWNVGALAHEPLELPGSYMELFAERHGRVWAVSGRAAAARQRSISHRQHRDEPRCGETIALS